MTDSDPLIHDPTPETGRQMQRLAAIMARLRDPATGCPWDLEQDFASIAPYTIEEAYEVADAIARGNMADLEGELGDLLLQSVYHAQMAAEAGHFDLARVARGIADKMVARHPHVFGTESRDKSADQQTQDWERLKAAERAARAETRTLDGVAIGLPALMRAVKLQKRAARVGFDWPSTDEVFDKLHEEVAELRVEIAAGDLDKARDEVGDLLFVVANLARKLGVEPEDALRGANAKFVRRFGFIEAELAKDGRSPEQSDLAEMDGLWDAAKAHERR